MKHKLYRLISLIGVLIFCLASAQKVKAEVSYNIKDNEVTSKVNSDGSISLKRKIVYEFHSNANGVFYRQNLNQNQKIKHLKVTTQTNDGPVNKYPQPEVSKTDKGYLFTVRQSVSQKNERLTVTYFYRITNAITNYRDVAELNFMIIGNGWNTKLENVKASIIFPGPVKDLQAWSHGPLENVTKVDPEKGRIVVTAKNLAGSTGIRIRTIFPTSVTAKNKNVEKVNRRQAIIKQEQKLANENKQKENRNLFISIGLILVSLVTGIFAIIKGFSAKKVGFKPAKIRNLAHGYEIPTADPVIAQIIDTTKRPNSKAFTAYLLELAKQKRIKIEEDQKGLKAHYRISAIDQNVCDENDLLKFLFFHVGDGESFTTKQIKKARGKKLGRQFDAWAEGQFCSPAKNRYMPNNLLDQNKKSNRTIVAARLVSLIAAAISVFFVRRFFWMVLIGEALIFIISWFSMFKNKWQTNLYSEEGVVEAEKVRSFKKMLKDIGRFDVKDIGDLTIWEDILPYAVSFGLAKKVLQKLKLEFGQEDLAKNNFYDYSFITNFNSCFIKGIAAGSTSVRNGGFGSNSSGGFGGGSGGGAF